MATQRRQQRGKDDTTAPRNPATRQPPAHQPRSRDTVPRAHTRGGNPHKRRTSTRTTQSQSRSTGITEPTAEPKSIPCQARSAGLSISHPSTGGVNGPCANAQARRPAWPMYPSIPMTQRPVSVYNMATQRRQQRGKDDTTAPRHPTTRQLPARQPRTRDTVPRAHTGGGNPHKRRTNTRTTQS